MLFTTHAAVRVLTLQLLLVLPEWFSYVSGAMTAVLHHTDKTELCLSSYGTMDALVELCCRHGELRTLQRTLMAGGARCTHQSLIVELSIAFSPAAVSCAPEVTIATVLRRGRAALDRLCERMQEEGPATDAAADDALAALPPEARLQFVHRCHLAMRRPDEAGAAAMLTHALQAVIAVSQARAYVASPASHLR